MITALTAAAVVSATLAIAADWQERRHRSFYILKPLTTLLIVGIALAASPSTALYQQCIVAALLLSLVGDVCLMFAGPGARAGDTAWFIGGLSSFLLAHLAFAAAFLQGVPAADPPGWLAVIVFYAAAMLYVLLPRAGALKLPVLAYCFVLAAMVFTAAVRHEALRDAESLRAVLGALLFLVSDSALGWRRFGGRYRHAQTLILSTYWLAIGLIAWSV